jgi:60 kDa SS-A/Ro ribonucleoprotein
MEQPSERGLSPIVRNNAGGTSHIVDLWNRLNRFLILGIEGGTYYVNEKTHTLNNVKVVDEALLDDPRRVISMLVEVSTNGRAPKNDYAIFVLAKAASHVNPNIRRYALSHLNEVCRTGTHLFQFIAFVDSMRGWGPGLRKAVANWYLSKSADSLAYQVLKYQNRENWSHRDVLRKTHPKTDSEQHNALFQYVTKGLPAVEDTFALPELAVAHAIVHQYPESADITVEKVQRYNLSREMVPTEHLTNREVLTALAENMPYMALMRNLGNLTRHGVFNGTELLWTVRSKLADPEYIQKSRVHPINILTALRTYGQGQGFRGSNTWSPAPPILYALEEAFYAAFKNVEPTGKRFMVGVDVSGSMAMRPSEGILTAAEIAAALSMMLVRTEEWVKVFGFHQGLLPFNFTRNHILEQVLKITAINNGGGTDASLLFNHAIENRIPTDVFVVITDNETWAHDQNRYSYSRYTTQRGGGMPSQRLKEYRDLMGIDAKLLVLATAATEFSIADPNDRGMLDIAGFDSAVPEIMREFVLGNI